MPWLETAPGRYERPFDTIERFYRGIAASGAHLGKQHWLVSSVVQCKHHISTIDLQDAWKSLRHQHPQIAASADDNGLNFVYNVPSTEALDVWVQETLVIHSDKENQNVEELDSALAPSDRFMLYYLPHSRQLLFRAPHWRTDGRGMIILQHSFFTLLAAGAGRTILFDGSEASQLPAPFDEAAELSLETTPEMSQSSDALLSSLSGSIPATLRESLPNTIPTISQRSTIQLPQELSEKIIRASKARGQTVTTTAHAALFTALREYADPIDGRFICFNPFDLRHHLPPPWNGLAGAASLYHTGKPCSIELAQCPDFKSLAHLLSPFYRNELKPLFGFLVDYMNKLDKILAAPLEVAIQGPGAARADLSSLGVIDNYLHTRYTGVAGTFEIEDWFLGVQIITRLLQMYLWTRDGKIHLSCNYNAAFYKGEFVQQLLEGWKDVLVKELLHIA
ncbi:uncharacterized protein N7496_009326 [Penicillium cataractarum]|uniref:Condensation domain-containing protein n=1 Tax=Penicillium cataractarum TaxID=2100454 RepID=A0A9W9RTM9_9EURO|nr:uncharacterized protein N7496_009326 [Penicillium cataractarum]KAJ5363613.1 hypothetical protein N7496_009326 [Penicillium cataractarum]